MKQDPNYLNDIDQRVISFRGLQKSIGVAGIAMPFIMVFGVMLFSDCNEVLRSISAYYHTVMRDAFLAIIAAFAYFLYSYRGYDKKDNRLTKIAALCAIGLALSPTKYRDVFECSCVPNFGFGAQQTLHLVFAITFFLVLTYISLFQFTKTNPNEPMTPQKKKRNKIYRICGWIMFGSLAGIGLYYLCEYMGDCPLVKFKPIFVLESVALIAFGTSWLIKGEAFFKDTK